MGEISDRPSGPGVTARSAAGPALAAERQFVKTLGGFVLSVAGAELVTHERVPLPRLNFVEVLGVDAGRQTAFFERALDHYFQRALRPTFRIPIPEPDHVVEGLRRFGFRPRPHPLVLLQGTAGRPTVAPPDVDVRVAESGELDGLASLWVTERGRAELRTAVDVAWHHPNPGERLTPVVAVRGGRIVSAALRYEEEGTVGIHFVTTRPGDRGQGAASALVLGALRPGDVAPGSVPFLFADSERLTGRLTRLGFAAVVAFREFELPPEAELDLPAPGPPTPPRWRPPRGSDGRDRSGDGY